MGGSLFLGVRRLVFRRGTVVLLSIPADEILDSKIVINNLLGYKNVVPGVG